MESVEQFSYHLNKVENEGTNNSTSLIISTAESIKNTKFDIDESGNLSAWNAKHGFEFYEDIPEENETLEELDLSDPQVKAQLITDIHTYLEQNPDTDKKDQIEKYLTLLEA